MKLFRHHKERAAAFLAKGKKKQALKEYRAALELNPGDVQVRQRLADLLLRLGYDDAAIREYQHVAGRYAADGMLVKAMAICKVILSIDPDHTETQSVLADLFAAHHPNAVLPPSMTAALAQPALRVTPAAHAGLATKSAAEPAQLAPPSPPPKPEGPPSVAPSSPSSSPSSALSSTTSGMEPLTPRRPSLPPLPGQGVLVAEAPSPAESPRSLDEPVEEEPSSGVWATPEDLERYRTRAPDDDPLTLLPGIFGLADDDDLRPDDSQSGIYLRLDEDEGGAELPDEAPVTESVDTSEMEVDRAGFPVIPLFSQLDKQAFIALFERLKVKSAPAGERLITEGQTTRTMYIVAQGEVRVFREKDGAEVEIARLGDGGFFGELALLSASPRMASVEATRNTILLEMTRDDVAEIVKRHPSVTDVLVRFYRERFLENLVRSNPLLFQPLSDEEKRAVFEHCQSVTVPPGTVLLEKGQMGQGLYLILRGECDISDVDEAGRPIALPSLQEGDFFGEMSLLFDIAATATVRARSTAVVLRLPREVFYEKVMKHAEVRRVLTEVTNERLRQAVEARHGFDDPVLL